MYLIDTNIISELRKADSANRGVIEFMSRASARHQRCYLSVITVGEIYRGMQLIRHRGDTSQADILEAWFTTVTEEYTDSILPIDQDITLVWANLRVPNYENGLDKLIAATALSHSLTLVTRNTKDFRATGVPMANPFV